MRVVATMLVAALLAGCSGPAAPDALAAQAPDPQARQTAVDALFDVEVPETCAPGFCYMAGSPTLLHTVGLDETVGSIVLDLGAAEGFDSPVDWEVTCRAPDEEDPACLKPLGAGREALPFHLELTDLGLPPATVVALLLAAPTTGHPAADMALEPSRGPSQVTGLIQSTVLPPDLRPPFEHRSLAVAWEGDSGPCAIIVDPDCLSPVGAYYGWPDVGGTVVAANLTLTWSSLTPADEVFRFHLGGRCSPSCPTPFVVTGPSPLHIEADGLDLGADPYFTVTHADPTGTDPTGFALLYFGTKTPLRLEGTLTVRSLPAVEA